MVVYRITLAVHAEALVASGNPARWNSEGIKVIYTSSSRSLACLENVVHRKSRGLSNQFKTMLVEIPGNLKIEKVDVNDLGSDWFDFHNYHITQKMGDTWITKGKSAVLQVPSVIIPGEFNYLINPEHKDFNRIKYVSNEPFEFDSRLIRR